MLFLSGVVKTASDGSNQHVHEFVVPRIWHSWLSVRKDGIPRGGDRVARDAATGNLSLLGLWVGPANAARCCPRPKPCWKGERGE